MAAGIGHMVTRLVRDMNAAFAARWDLAGKLDAYFEIAVWPMYELRQSMPDAADFERGMGPASVAASRQGFERNRAVLRAMLREQRRASGPSPESVAAFVEQSTSRAKMSDIPRTELESFLAVLKASVIARAAEPWLGRCSAGGGLQRGPSLAWRA
jgi:hypothetical protein